MTDLESTLNDPNVFVKCLDNAVRENKGDGIKDLTGWYLRKSLIEPQVGVGSSLLKAYLELDSQPVVALSTLNTIFDICMRGLEKLQSKEKASEVTDDFLKNARDSYVNQLKKVEWACISRAIDYFSKDDREKGDFWYTRSTDAAELLKQYQPKEAKQ